MCQFDEENSCKNRILPLKGTLQDPAVGMARLPPESGQTLDSERQATTETRGQECRGQSRQGKQFGQYQARTNFTRHKPILVCKAK